MASVYKPRYTLPMPEGAERILVKGRPHVRYTDGKGRTHTRPVRIDRDGNETTQMVCEQRTWWMKYRLPDGTVRREKGFRDKLATEQEAARREREAHHAAAGVLLVDTKHLSRPIGEHFDAYRDSLKRAGRAPKYYEPVRTRLGRTADLCGWHTLQQITPNGMESSLTELANQGLSPKTINEYLATAKSFAKWCVRTRRLGGNPLEGVQRIDYQKGNDKAALTHEQAETLLAAAGKNRLLYLVALRTGLRRGELELLQWGDIHFDVERPHIVLRAATTKARRADVVPLRAEVSVELKAARPTGAKPTDRVFPAIPRNSRGFLPDLDKAGIPRQDDWGKKYCFHSLRVTFGTWLAQAGVAPRVHMELMRHTDMKLTMQFYTDPRLLDTTRAVSELPSLGLPVEKAAAKRTGTDGVPVQVPDDFIALNRGSECPRQSTSGHFGRVAARGNPPHAAKNADADMEMVEAVGIEPTSGCL